MVVSCSPAVASDKVHQPAYSSTLSGIQSHFVELPSRGLRMHYLESGRLDAQLPLVLLLHGFPELAFSWRHQLPAIAAAGYRVVAMDHRNFGHTEGGDASYEDADLDMFAMHSLVQDTLAFVTALGHKRAELVVGHDFGSPLAAYCALMHPEVFASVVCMSAPFAGVPLPPRKGSPSSFAKLADLDPPRKHYLDYYSGPGANADMLGAPQGLRDLLRAYFHVKSADWDGTRGPGDRMPRRLEPQLKALAFAGLPHFYVMPADASMAQVAAAGMPSETEEREFSVRWLPEEELAVFVAEYSRTGFQGGLNWYRCATRPPSGQMSAMHAWHGKKVQVPAAFIAGAADWGIYQSPGAFERMPAAFTDFRGAHLVSGAGHWVQQERPSEVTELLLCFLEGLGTRTFLEPAKL